MKRRQFIILIILLVIGFASVTTTLVLNGNVEIGVELDDFDVIFVEALLDGKEDPKATISEDKKTITFSTDRLSNVGDSTRLDYKVKNTSTQYDADVIINCTNEANDYVTVTSEFDGNSLPLENLVNIKAQEVKSGYINAELTKAYSGDDNSIEISCNIVFTATSREEYAYALSFDSNGGSKIDDKSVVLNDNYGELSIPEREGYNFLGWYDEEDNKVDSSTIFDTKGNRNLYAKWEEKVYSVSIITNANGTSEASSIDVLYSKTNNIKITPSNNYYISNIECSDEYTVENYNAKVPKYGEQTITIKNNTVPKEGTCTFTFEQGIFEYGYTGGEQSFSAPLNGSYKIELWGAQGGNTSFEGGKGGYTSGKISLTQKEKLFIQTGSSGIGNTTSSNVLSSGGYNGGGYGSYGFNCSGGGGATDVRLVNGNWSDFNSLKSRIMIAAGGGGSCNYRVESGLQKGGSGGPGGGLNGYNGNKTANVSTTYPGYGAIQTRGGLAARNPNEAGMFARGADSSAVHDDRAGGGGGYYGGGASNFSAGAGGGSSFVSGHNGCNAITNDSTSSNIIHTGQSNHYSGYVFTDTVMVDGAGYKWTNVKESYTGMPNHAGTSTITGNTGNGYAKITLITID